MAIAAGWAKTSGRPAAPRGGRRGEGALRRQRLAGTHRIPGAWMGGVLALRLLGPGLAASREPPLHRLGPDAASSCRGVAADPGKARRWRGGSVAGGAARASRSAPGRTRLIRCTVMLGRADSRLYRPPCLPPGFLERVSKCMLLFEHVLKNVPEGGLLVFGFRLAKPISHPPSREGPPLCHWASLDCLSNLYIYIYIYPKYKHI